MKPEQVRELSTLNSNVNKEKHLHLVLVTKDQSNRRIKTFFYLFFINVPPKAVGTVYS